MTTHSTREPRAIEDVPQKGTFTPHEAADILAVSLSSVYNYCDEGRLAYVAAGSRRITRESIIQCLKPR